MCSRIARYSSAPLAGIWWGALTHIMLTISGGSKGISQKRDNMQFKSFLYLGMLLPVYALGDACISWAENDNASVNTLQVISILGYDTTISILLSPFPVRFSSFEDVVTEATLRTLTMPSHRLHLLKPMGYVPKAWRQGFSLTLWQFIDAAQGDCLPMLSKRMTRAIHAEHA